MKNRIILSVTLISVPLILRVIFNFMYIFMNMRDPLITNSLSKNNYIFPIYVVAYYLITKLLPMGAQYISVMTAVMHFKSHHSTNDLSSNIMTEKTVDQKAIDTSYKNLTEESSSPIMSSSLGTNLSYLKR